MKDDGPLCPDCGFKHPDTAHAPGRAVSCCVHLISFPPYIGGDDDEVEAWQAECCQCGWKGTKAKDPEVARREGAAHLPAVSDDPRKLAEQALTQHVPPRMAFVLARALLDALDLVEEWQNEAAKLAARLAEHE